MISDTPDYGGDAMGLLMLVGVLATLKLLILYRATRKKRYLKASIGAMLLVTSTGIYAFTEVLLLPVILGIPAVILVVTNLPVRFRFRHDERWERSRADATEPKCEHCGYDLRGTIAAGIYACPERNERASDAVIEAWRHAGRREHPAPSSSRPGADS